MTLATFDFEHVPEFVFQSDAIIITDIAIRPLYFCDKLCAMLGDKNAKDLHDERVFVIAFVAFLEIVDGLVDLELCTIGGIEISNIRDELLVLKDVFFGGLFKGPCDECIVFSVEVFDIKDISGVIGSGTRHGCNVNHE